MYFVFCILLVDHENERPDERYLRTEFRRREENNFGHCVKLPPEGQLARQKVDGWYVQCQSRILLTTLTAG